MSAVLFCLLMSVVMRTDLPICQGIGGVDQVWLLLATGTDACWVGEKKDLVSANCHSLPYVGIGIWYVLFKAFQIPGCVKDINPTRITLNRGVRNHLASLDRGLLLVVVPIWSSLLLLLTADMLVGSQAA